MQAKDPAADDANRISSAVGDYLKAIWSLSQDGPATTNAIAERLGFTPASVSGMLGRLSDNGLVDHVRYRGARLTDDGRREALRLIRRHRLIETFMIRELGYRWDEVHDEAETIEHAVNDRFAERLATLLGDPSHDPHGDPIPTADGDVPATPDVPLDEVGHGTVLEVARLMSQDSDTLAYLGNLGIEPHAHLTVVGREPRGGLIEIEVGGRRTSLSRDLAQLVRGEVIM